MWIRLYANERQQMEEIQGPDDQELDAIQVAQQYQLELCMGEISLLLAQGRTLYTRNDIYDTMDRMLDRYQDMQNEG